MSPLRRMTRRRSGVDRRHGGLHEPDAEVVGDLAQRAALGRAAAEHLRHQHRPQHEVRLRGDERHPQAIARELPQREHELERGDPASDDDDLGSCGACLCGLRWSISAGSGLRPACVSAPTRDSTGRPWTSTEVLVQALQVPRQLAAGDLGRRPPQGTPRDGRRRRRRTSRRRNRDQRSVSSMPRSTGVNGVGSSAAPARAAMCSAAASACWQARPPCLIGKAVTSPAA